jgi:hypothetical protein
MNPQGPQMQLTREHIVDILRALEVDRSEAFRMAKDMPKDGSEERLLLARVVRCTELHMLLMGASQVSV